MNKKIILQISVLTLLISILCTVFWLYNNRDKAVYQRIINQDGYSLSLVKEGVSVDFFLKPEWIPKEPGEKKLNLVVAKKFDSDIVLKKVGKRDKDFYILLDIVPHPDRISGQLLSTSLIANHSFTYTGGFKWKVTDASGKDLLRDQYGTGQGPGNATEIFIDDAHLEKFGQGVHIRFSGFNLYGYHSYNKSSYGILPSIIVTALVIGGLILLYKKRTDPEKGLGWKLIGHMLLGGFTFTLNSLRLPLGFAIYLLFFRKPRPNLAIKQMAALLGLLMYVWQLAGPAITKHLGSERQSTTIRNISAEELGVDGLWKMVAARAPVSSNARIQSFETVHTENGEVFEMNFEFIEHNSAVDRFLHTSVTYRGQDQSVFVKRYNTTEWLQYPREMMAEHFIERVQSLKLMDLDPIGDDHRYVKLSLFPDSTQASYAMKDESNFGVDDKGVYRIRDEQLPVTATLLQVCAPQSLEPTADCNDYANYFFDITEGGARQ